MRCIQELSPEEAGAVRGVCFDVDDTLTSNGVLDAEAYTALHRLHSAGLFLIAATGRPLAWAELFARTWPVDAAVGENGAGWCFRRGTTLQHGFARSAAERARDRERLDPLAAQIAQRMPDVQPTSDSWGRRCDLAWDVGESVRLAPERIRDLVGLIEAAGARSVVSTVHAHATFDDCDKATGIRAAALDALDVRLEEEPLRWLFVGDSGNDAAAFAWFPLSAGVANVRDFLPHLPKAPRFVARERCGKGFAEIVDVLLDRRGGG